MRQRPIDLGGDESDGWARPKKRSDEAELDITPMIDVTFLLLIFFMVTSTMTQETDLDVPVAEHGQGVETSAVTLVTVRNPAVTGGVPEIELEGKLDATLDDVRQAVEEGVAAGRSEVVIKADREVPFGFEREIMRVVGSVDGATFRFEVKDKTRP